MCGGKRGLGEVCRAQGLDFGAMRLELEEAMQDKSPLETDWRQASLRDLIRHIVSTHHEYLKLELPRLNERLNKVLSAHGDKGPGTLSSLSNIFSGLWEELDGHMQKEELVLFPSIERMEATVTAGQPLPRLPFGTIGNPITMMEREHDNAGLALRQIREATHDFHLPENKGGTAKPIIDKLPRWRHLVDGVARPEAVRERTLPGRAGLGTDREGTEPGDGPEG